MNKVLVVNDLNSICNSSLNVTIPIMSNYSLQCCPLPTAIYSNPKCYSNLALIDCTEKISEFLKIWNDNKINFDAIMTGFFVNIKQIEILENYISEHKESLVLIDPVMGDNGYLFGCYDENYVKKMQKFIKNAGIITPNLTELCLLTDVDYNYVISKDIVKQLIMVQNMSQKIGKKVITTGILDDDFIITAVYDNGFNIIKTYKYGDRVAGTGDIFTSLVFSQYLNGINLLDATRYASNYISNVIKNNMESDSFDANQGLLLKKI